MATRRRSKSASSSIDASRLTILASTDSKAFLTLANEMLASGDRLAREAALDALTEHPSPDARAPLRALYTELDADGVKRDQGTPMRGAIVMILDKIADARDADIALRAVETRETAFGEDIAWRLRARGLQLLANIAPDVFPYIAVEHLEDHAGDDNQPANTAFQLLAATGHHVAIYQWLVSGQRDPVLIAGMIDLLSDAPDQLVDRYVRIAMERGLRSDDDRLATVLTETIVERELEDSYPAIQILLSSKISEELYNYIAVLLAGTNRQPLLAILERELHRGRRPKVVAEALRIRSTPEQEAILRRWEAGDSYEEPE